MSHLLSLGLCLTLLAPSAQTDKASPGQVKEAGGATANSDISGEEAVQIAKKNAARKYKSLDKYNVALCDLGLTWRVIFELKDPRSDGRGPEYVIAKLGGYIIHVEVTAHRLPARDDRKKADPQEHAGISREEALTLAEAQALKTYGSTSDFNVSVCELLGSWYVAFYFKRPLTRGGAPQYIIDKRTGKIIESRFYT